MCFIFTFWVLIDNITNMISTISEKKLKYLIRESIREVLSSEFMKFRAYVLSAVSRREQKDIEKRYGKLSRRKSKSYTF